MSGAELRCFLELHTGFRIPDDRWAFLEYVPGDDPACLVGEATTLRAWTGEAGRA